jgi:3-methylfumaryl-CoA hydratase
MAGTLDITHLQQWIGRSQAASDVVTAQLVRALRATLFMEIGEPAVGEVAPLTAHWCLAQPVAPISELGPDGHPARGHFLPPIDLPRRMWAGGTLEFPGDLRVGDEVERHSKIADIAVKSGRSGTLCFVTVDHTISTPRGIAIRERQDIVYRDISSNPKAEAAPPGDAPIAQHSIRHLADPVLLFRYSALTFNGHRIHYDRDYVTKVEGYPGLIVHGPLQASLLVEYAARLKKGRRPARMAYRGIRPLFDRHEFSLNAAEENGDLSLWVADQSGHPTMTARADW